MNHANNYTVAVAASGPSSASHVSPNSLVDSTVARIARGSSAPSESFGDALQSALRPGGSGSLPGDQDPSSFINTIRELAASWSDGQTQMRSLHTQAPEALQPLLRAQNLSQVWNLRMQLLSSGMQHIQQSVRQLQQAGGA